MGHLLREEVDEGHGAELAGGHVTEGVHQGDHRVAVAPSESLCAGGEDDSRAGLPVDRAQEDERFDRALPLGHHLLEVAVVLEIGRLSDLPPEYSRI